MKSIIVWIVLLMISTTGMGRTFDEIYKRPVPKWFNEDKFGIFVVWGVYSVPSYRIDGYAEWYWKEIDRVDSSRAFHDRVYGKEFQYETFVDQFRAELWDPDFWCKLFKDSGAKYVVTCANYHDGFAMYPTEYSKTASTDVWNSAVAGPKRDVLGELNKAGEKVGLKMGIYYSLYEWHHPWWLNDKERFVKEWFHPKFKEVVSKYKPWHIFLDGEWWLDYEEWKTEELADWLYNESPVKDTVVVNDRWGECRGKFGDVFESEYGGGKYTAIDHPWQEDRGIGKSYGYNRSESVYDYDSREELLRMFSGVVGGGGNFLLCVGPTADGRIPVIMQERLLEVGQWLEINGDAIYGTTASPFWPRQFKWGTVSKKPGKLFFHIYNPMQEEIHVKGVQAEITKAVLLHKRGQQEVQFTTSDSELHLKWNRLLNDEGVTIIELDVADGYVVDKAPRQLSDGEVSFNCWAMQMHGEKIHPFYGGGGSRLFIKDWATNDFVSAEFIVDQPGTFDVELLYASKESLPETTVGGKYKLIIGDHVTEAVIVDQDNDAEPKPIHVATITLDQAGTYPFKVEVADTKNWNGFLFQAIKLTPVK